VTAAATRRSRLTQWQILNLSLLIAGYTGYYLCRSNLAVTMPLLIAEFGCRGVRTSTAQVMLGTIASYGVLAYAIGKFPSGSWADRFGGKCNFLFGMAGSIVCTFLFAASGAMPIFTLAWVGNRLAQSLGWAGAVKIISRWFTFRRYGTVMAVFSLSFLFGDAAARQFMAALIWAGLGWRGVFLVGAAVLSVLLVICAWLVRESPSEIGEPEPKANPKNLFLDRDEHPQNLFTLLTPFVESRAFWLACALSLGTTILRETFNLWTPTYFTQSAGMTAAQAASTSALFPLFGGISVIVCGWLSDRLARGGRTLIMLIGLALTTLLLLAIGSGVIPASETVAVSLVTMVAFLIMGPYSFLAGAISLDFGGKQGSGTASGLIDGVGYLGGVISGDTMARISARYGWGGAFIVLAAIAFLSSIAAAAFLRRERLL